MTRHMRMNRCASSSPVSQMTSPGPTVGFAWFVTPGPRAARFARVRVVSLPMSDYCRFGLWASQFTVAAGEDIRYLTRDKTEAAELPNHDYWLFDSRKLLLMHFDEADGFLGGEVIENAAEIVKHNYWRDAAWHYAVGRDDFATEQHLRGV